jgi:hypothetical protein
VRTETRPDLSACERAAPGAGNLVPFPEADSRSVRPVDPETGETLENPVPAWLWNTFMDGLSKLFSLRLDGSPPEETLEVTAMTWIEACCYGRTFEANRDRERLNEGFRLLLRVAERWPAPALFLKCVPERREPKPEPSATAKAAPPNDAAPWPAYSPTVLRDRLMMSLRADRIALLEQGREDKERANEYCREIEAGLRERPTSRPAPRRRRPKS